VLAFLGSAMLLLPGLFSLLATGDPDIGQVVFEGETPGWFDLAGFLLGLPILFKAAAWIDAGGVRLRGGSSDSAPERRDLS
jgi:hypothetical protein